MTEPSITFPDDMILAILAGRKTQARAVMERQPSEWCTTVYPTECTRNNAAFFWEVYKDGELTWWPDNLAPHGASPSHIDCPFGQVGDRILVQEAWHPLGVEGRNYRIPVYRAGWTDEDDATLANDGLEPIIWQPAETMPRYASRITLELTGAGVQRLQDITCGGYLYRSQVQLEGCPFDNDATLMGSDEMKWFKPRWDAEHPEHPWESNPWIWLLDFKMVKP